jgi:osmoprotectant transport system permease protein
MGPLLVLGQDLQDRWLDWPWVSDHFDEIWVAFRAHVELTVLAVAIGLLISLPLGIVAYRHRRLYPPILGTTGVLFTIPSLAMFMLLIPWTGISRTTALIPLVVYTLLILVRNVYTGLDGVPEEVREAATGVGLSSSGRLVRVELPLAIPAIIAGIRIATVTTIGLVTVTSVIGQENLGDLMFNSGFQRSFRTPVTVAIILVVVMAVTFDLLLILVQRLLTPWSSRRFRRAAA